MKTRLLIVVAFATLKLCSQNLVTNPSFEMFSTCPWTQGQMNATGWQVTANSGVSSPDYFNTCATSEVGVPNNVSGTQLPHNGNAYAGIFVYGNNSSQREYIQTELSAPMVGGQTYQISFYVSRGDNHGTAIGSLGAYVSPTAITGTGVVGPIILAPQISSATLISDAAGWTEISGAYTAAGGERFLTLGNFSTDATTPYVTVVPNPVFWFWGYYYIDSVSVTANPLSTADNIDLGIKMYPNPVNDMLYLEFPDDFGGESISIFDITGKEVMEIRSVVPGIGVSQLDTGIYFIRIRSNGISIIKKFVKN